MRQDLATATANYLNHVRINTPYPQPSSYQRKQMISIAHYIALMRTRVMARYYHGQIVDMDITEPEVPTRVAKQLKKLAIGLAIVRQHGEITYEDMRIVKRVAKDCAIPTRRRIIEHLATFMDKNVLPFQIADSTKLPLNTVLNELAKMQMLGIVETKKSLAPAKEGEKNSNNELDFFAFTPQFAELHNLVYK